MCKHVQASEANILRRPAVPHRPQEDINSAIKTEVLAVSLLNDDMGSKFECNIKEKKPEKFFEFEFMNTSF